MAERPKGKPTAQKLTRALLDIETCYYLLGVPPDDATRVVNEAAMSAFHKDGVPMQRRGQEILTARNAMEKGVNILYQNESDQTQGE